MATKQFISPKKKQKSDRKPESKDDASPLLGAHMSIRGGPAKALERGRSIGCMAIQIFVKNNMQWFAKPLPPSELEQYHTFQDRPSVVFGHASYLINPGTNNPAFLEKSTRALEEELLRADQLGLPFLVLHPGAHMGDGETAGLSRIVATLDAVFAAVRTVRCRISSDQNSPTASSLASTPPTFSRPDSTFHPRKDSGK